MGPHLIHFKQVAQVGDLQVNLAKIARGDNRLTSAPFPLGLNFLAAFIRAGIPRSLINLG